MDKNAEKTAVHIFQANADVPKPLDDLAKSRSSPATTETSTLPTASPSEDASWSGHSSGGDGNDASAKAVVVATTLHPVPIRRGRRRHRDPLDETSHFRSIRLAL
jgi:hypothetical protein